MIPLCSSEPVSLFLVFSVFSLFAVPACSTERCSIQYSAVFRTIGEKLCHTRCIVHGLTLNVEYVNETSTCDQSRHESKKAIDCGPYIDFPDISDFIQKKQHRLLDEDRKVLQCCYSVLGGEPNWVWKNASIEVYGRFLIVKFYAGSQCNKYVVSINNEKVNTQCVNRGLRLKLRDGFRSVFSWIAGTAQTVLGAVAGGGMRMLTFQLVQFLFRV